MKKKNNRKTRIGIVVSDKMNKTVVVLVERVVLHTQFKKGIVRKNRFKAHDENNTCKAGDKVLIEETRPLSRDKRWRVRKTLEKAPQ